MNESHGFISQVALAYIDYYVYSDDSGFTPAI